MLVAQVLPRAQERLAVLEVGRTVGDAAELMAGTDADLVVVCAGGVIVGVVTASDVFAHLSNRLPGLADDADIGAIMTEDFVSCLPTDYLVDVWLTMNERNLQSVPIVDAELKPLGVLQIRDALQGLLLEATVESAMLRDYISGVGYR